MKTKKSFPLTMALAAAVLTTSASAQLLSVDFNNAGDKEHLFHGAAVLGSAGDTWHNQVVLGGKGITAFYDGSGWQVDKLLLVDGVTESTVGFNIKLIDPDPSNTTPKAAVGRFAAAVHNENIPSSILDLKRDYMFMRNAGGPNWGQDAYFEFTLTGLSVNTEYKLVLYAGGDQPGQGATFSNFSSSVTLLNGISSAYLPDSPYTQKVDPVLGEDYIGVEFTTGAAQTSLSFRIGSNGTAEITGLAGFQLQVISEPVLLGSISVSW